MHAIKNTRPKIALALAGGGPLGAIYEDRRLCALEESLDGLDLTKLDHYVGVSAGGFIVAGTGQRHDPRELCASFIENGTQPSETFRSVLAHEAAYGEFARRGIMRQACCVCPVAM
jgi:NTE family protein